MFHLPLCSAVRAGLRTFGPARLVYPPRRSTRAAGTAAGNAELIVTQANQVVWSVEVQVADEAGDGHPPRPGAAADSDTQAGGA